MTCDEPSSTTSETGSGSRPRSRKSATRPSVALGRWGEDRAAAWYSAAGYRTLDRNWRVQAGELDLVCAIGSVVVFVEVKTRSSSRFGSGAEAVGRNKQQRIRRLGRAWLQASPETFRYVRFDVVDVDARGNVVVYEAAF